MNVQTQFFTLWVFVLVCLAPLTCKYINVLFLSSIVLLVGSYFSFIEPGFYTLDNGKIIQGRKRFIYVDLIMHFLPWVFILWYQGNGKLIPIQEKWKGTLLVVVAYTLAYPPWEINVYNVPFWKMGSLLAASCALYQAGVCTSGIQVCPFLKDLFVVGQSDRAMNEEASSTVVDTNNTVPTPPTTSDNVV